MSVARRATDPLELATETLLRPALAADTDGIDGAEENAGAIVTPDALARAAALGLNAKRMLANNDGFGFFGALGELVVTGPTRTNVNDYRVILVQ